MKGSGKHFDRVIVTCEHAGNKVPGRFASLFKGRKKLLETHEGYDIGAWDAARHFASALDAPLFGHHTTRLLVEGNRCLTSRQLFSRFSRSLPDAELQWLLEHSWFPFRVPASQAITKALDKGQRVLQLSVHSFTPVWKGRKRSVDIGLLYDPKTPQEKAWCADWRRTIKRRRPGFSVVTNKPYTGLADGFAQSLRIRLKHPRLIAMEIEINQKYPEAGGRDWGLLKRQLADSLLEANG